MGFLEHLEELRTRLIRSCIAIGAGMLVAFGFADRIAEFVEGPILAALPAGSTLVYVRPGEAFSFYLDLALIAGAVLASPFVMYQLWKFIAPALYSNEKRFVVPFVVLTTLGALSGAAFSHYVAFPTMIRFFGSFDSPSLQFLPRIDDTFGLYKTTLLGMVAIFQLPTLVYFLARMRLVTARFLWRHIKYAVFASVVLAAVLTPSTDWWNQAVFAGPMMILYLFSIGIAWLVAPRVPLRSSDGHLRLVVGAMVANEAARHLRRPS